MSWCETTSGRRCWSSQYVKYNSKAGTDSPRGGDQAVETAPSLGLKVPAVNEVGGGSWRPLAGVYCDCVKCNMHSVFLSEDAVKRCDVSWRLERNGGCGLCTNK